MNTHVQILKVWLKSVLLWRKYSIFSRGLFFIGAPCRLYCIVLLTVFFFLLLSDRKGKWKRSIKVCSRIDLQTTLAGKAFDILRFFHDFMVNSYPGPAMDYIYLPIGVKCSRLKAEIPREQFPCSTVVASSLHTREDVANMSQGNRACRTCWTRMLATCPQSSRACRARGL